MVTASICGPAYLYRQILANLWARGAGLQSCFSRELIDLVIPVSHGSTEPGSIFDPSLLSAAVQRIKNREAGDSQVKPAIHPVDVLRNRRQPLPYLTILMELDYEAQYQETGLKIKCQVSEPLSDSEFEKLNDASEEAAKKYWTYRQKKKTKNDTLKRLKEKADNAWLAAHPCSRYSISVRGASPDVYGVLRKANIANSFATLLSIILPPFREEDSMRKHMRPLERLSDESPHTAWTWKYGVSYEAWVGPTRKPM